MKLSARNQLKGTVISVEKGPVSAKVKIDIGSGNVITSPMLWVANKAMEQCHKFLTEFGMTPASRGRISVSKPGEDTGWNKLLDFCKETTNV